MPGDYKGNRGIAQNIISALIGEGYRTAQIIDFLGLNELTYRTQYMYQDINRLRLENIAAGEIKNFSADQAVPDRLMRQWVGDTEYKYRVVIKYEYFDTSTLTRGTTGTTIYFDHAPSQAEVMEHWDVRRQTIESMYNNVQEVYGASQILYFRNLAP